MIRRLLLLLLGSLLSAGTTGWAQQYDTPPFNFDRSMDSVYVDSLLRSTRLRLLALNRLPPSGRVDTARLELLHFTAYVQYSGITHRDSALLLAKQLVLLAQRQRNIKYQIKGRLLLERCYRAFKIDYPRAIRENYTLLSLIDTAPAQYAHYVWRVYRNLGNISNALGEYDEATTYLQTSLRWFEKDPRRDTIHRADLHQYLADSYKRRQRLPEAQVHYLTAWQLINQTRRASVLNKAYLTNEIGRLYNSWHQPARAIPYLKQSVAFWAQLNGALPQADALADLAEAYAELGQYAEASASAEEALAKNQKVPATLLTAYAVLIRVNAHQHRWQQAFLYQQRYNVVNAEQQRAINQVESLRSKARYDQERLRTAYEQARLLQQQRYQTLAKQAEINQLHNAHRTHELRRQAQLSALQHQLETQQLRATAARNQTIQQATIKQLKIDQLNLGLSAQKRLQRQLFGGIMLISLLGLLLLYYSLRLRRANAVLSAKNREIELALLKGQTLERKRVATELHDRVSSLLGATKMTFQTIDATTLLPRDKKLYENSLDLLNDAVTQVRQLSHNLLPEHLLQQDLVASLKNLIGKLNLTGKTVFTFTHNANHNVQLPHEATFNLYVICLELCTNVLRHAQARHACLRLIHYDDGLAILLTDDGVGLQTVQEMGMGLQNIRDRAEGIGAQFLIESAGGTGTKASVVLPVSAL